MQSPLVSVLLPVYNGEPYLKAAIDSILAQTFTDFECIIIDDGSSDGSAALILGLDDPRIRFYQQANRGLPATLNRGLSLARGVFIARQDQDDLSHPDRLGLQVAYLQSHPECVLLGTWAQMMEVDRPVNRYHRHPVDDLTLRYQLLFNNPFVHSSVLMRSEAVHRVGGYSMDPEKQPPEDYELWSRLSREGTVANLGQVLLTYREVPGSMSRIVPRPFSVRLIRLCSENIAMAAGVHSADRDVRAMAVLTYADPYELEETPDFARMKRILFAAIDSFSVNEQASRALRVDASTRIKSLQATWFIQKTPLLAPFRRYGVVRALARLVRRLLFVFRRSA